MPAPKRHGIRPYTATSRRSRSLAIGGNKVKLQRPSTASRTRTKSPVPTYKGILSAKAEEEFRRKRGKLAAIHQRAQNEAEETRRLRAKKMKEMKEMEAIADLRAKKALQLALTGKFDVDKLLAANTRKRREKVKYLSKDELWSRVGEGARSAAEARERTRATRCDTPERLEMKLTGENNFSQVSGTVEDVSNLDVHFHIEKRKVDYNYVNLTGSSAVLPFYSRADDALQKEQRSEKRNSRRVPAAKLGKRKAKLKSRSRIKMKKKVVIYSPQLSKEGSISLGNALKSQLEKKSIVSKPTKSNVSSSSNSSVKVKVKLKENKRSSPTSDDGVLGPWGGQANNYISRDDDDTLSVPETDEKIIVKNRIQPVKGRKLSHPRREYTKGSAKRPVVTKPNHGTQYQYNRSSNFRNKSFRGSKLRPSSALPYRSNRNNFQSLIDDIQQPIHYLPQKKSITILNVGIPQKQKVDVPKKLVETASLQHSAIRKNNKDLVAVKREVTFLVNALNKGGNIRIRNVGGRRPYSAHSLNKQKNHFLSSQPPSSKYASNKNIQKIKKKKKDSVKIQPFSFEDSWYT